MQSIQEALRRLKEDRKETSLLKEKIKDFYVDFFDNDELGLEINSDLTFEELYKRMKKGEDAYKIIEVNDSIVRERVFAELADRLGVDYDTIFYLWLDQDDLRAGKVGRHGTPVEEGISRNMSIEDIAKKHNVTVEDIEVQVKIGIEVEKEHTDSEEEAKRIALDHLFEIPDYYSRLKKMEKEALDEELRPIPLHFDVNDSRSDTYAPASERAKVKTFVDGDRVRCISNKMWTKSGDENIGRTGTIVGKTYQGTLPVYSIKADDERIDIRGYKDTMFNATADELEMILDESVEDKKIYKFEILDDHDDSMFNLFRIADEYFKSNPEEDRFWFEFDVDEFKKKFSNYDEKKLSDLAFDYYNEMVDLTHYLYPMYSMDNRNKKYYDPDATAFDKIIAVVKDKYYDDEHDNLDESIYDDDYFKAESEVDGWAQSDADYEKKKRYDDFFEEVLDFGISRKYIKDLYDYYLKRYDYWHKEIYESLNESKSTLTLDSSIYDWYSKRNPTDYQLDNIDREVTFRDVLSFHENGGDVEDVLLRTDADGWIDSAVVEVIINKAIDLSEGVDEALNKDIIKESARFSPTKRTAVDGKEWWVVYDNKENKYTTLLPIGGKYKTKKDCQYAIDRFIEKFPKYESISEATIKTKSGKWVNKGKDGTHGTFKTKKEAEAQRKAMFAQGYSVNEELKEIPENILKIFEGKLKEHDIEIESKGKTVFGRIHYQLKGPSEYILIKVLEGLDQEMSTEFNIPTTYSIDGATAGVDLDKMYVEDKYIDTKIDLEESIETSWDYFDKFESIVDEYMPNKGEGETMASQIVTAVNKLIYKWYNDRDVYDNTHYLGGWFNDLSSYANWLHNNAPETSDILKDIDDALNDEDYENILRRLADLTLNEDFLSKYSGKPKKGSIYNEPGIFRFEEYSDEEEDEYDDEEGYYDEDDVDESLNEDLVFHLTDKEKEEIQDWWNKVEQWNADNGFSYSIDNSREPGLTDDEYYEELHAAMFDMLNDLKDKNPGLYKKGKKIYNKKAMSKISEEVEDASVIKEIEDNVYANSLIGAINAEWDTVQDYQIIVNQLSEHEEFKKFIPVIDDIIKDEKNHIGNLQKVLDEITPKTLEDIKDGEGEAIETLDKEKVNEDLNKATPYMLRNDGELIECSPKHPYVKYIFEGPEQVIERLSGEGFADLLWFYNNTNKPKTREYLESVVKYLKNNSLIEDVKHFNITENTYEPQESEIQEFIKILNDDTNQEFLKVRTSHPLYGGNNNSIYFRISSIGFNWFDLIWKIVYEFRNNISDITVSKDSNTFGGRYTPYKLDNIELDHIPIDEFITLEGNPVVEDLENNKTIDLPIIEEALKRLREGWSISEAFDNLRPSHAHGFYEKMIRDHLRDDNDHILRRNIQNITGNQSVDANLEETYSKDELKKLVGKTFNQQKINNIYRRKKYDDQRLFAATKCTRCGREKKVYLSNLINDPDKYGSCICSDTSIDSKIENAEKLYSNKKILRSNTSGYTGVSYIKNYRGEPYGKWRAYIEIDGKRSYLGDFDTKKDAIKARKEAGEKGIKWYKENRNKLAKDLRKRTKKYDKSKYRDTDRKVSVLKKDEK